MTNTLTMPDTDFPLDESPAQTSPFASTLPDPENDTDYQTFMRNEAAAAHARYFALTPAQRERIRSWNEYAQRKNASA